MRVSLPLLVAAAAGAMLLTACSGGNNSGNRQRPTASASAGAAVNVSATPTRQVTSTPGIAQTPLPPQPAAASVPAGGTPGVNGCLSFPLTPLDTSNLPTQVPRPSVPITELTVPASAMPPGFKADDAGQYNPQEQRTATDLAQGTPNPQAALQHLQQIGFLGGRQQGFTGPTTRGAIATVTVQHLIFSSDAGASNFLHTPVISAVACVRQERAPQIGQEANALSYTAPTAQNSIPFEGFSVAWRCGRVLINVTVAGAPGLYNLAQTDQIAQKVQAAYLQTGQPCS